MSVHDGMFLVLTNFCNTQINNTNDYQIAKIILENISKAKELSLERIADEACISQASVSRFIKKSGFSSFQQFKETCHRGMPGVQHHREMFHMMRFNLKDDQSICDDIFNDLMANLQATKDSLDINKLKQILKKMKQARSVSFYGDDHTLAQFFTLQIDLLVNQIPSYLFKKDDIQEIHSSFLKENDVVVFLNVSLDFITPNQKNMLLQLKKQGAYLVLIGQETNDEIDQYFDDVYLYGKEKTYNFGFYSLQYLSQIMSELFYRV